MYRPADPAVVSENRDIGALALALGADGRTINLVRLLTIVAAIIALVLSVRRDREVSFMVMLSASLLISPLLWSHYLATLVVPSAFLAQRLWKPLILLPLLAWLPIMAPALVATTMLLPFLVRDTQDEQVPEPVRLPA